MNFWSAEVNQMDFEQCSTPTKDSLIVVQENRSRFEVQNPNRYTFLKTEVDGCLILDNHEKCDWIISTEEPIPKAMFIELKGCDVDKAISQLISTLSDTKDRYKTYKRECYAVTTRIPKHGSSIRKKCIDFHKRTNTTLFVKNLRASVKV